MMWLLVRVIAGTCNYPVLVVDWKSPNVLSMESQVYDLSMTVSTPPAPHPSAGMRRRPPCREPRDAETTVSLRRWAVVERQGECNVASAGVVEADGAPERLEQRVGRACGAMAAHVRAVSPHQYDLRRMRLAFKLGPGARFAPKDNLPPLPLLVRPASDALGLGAARDCSKLPSSAAVTPKRRVWVLVWVRKRGRRHRSVSHCAY